MKTKRLLIIVPLTLLIAAVTARAVPIDYIANLTGPSEEPPNASPGTGFADVTFDLVAHTMRVQIISAAWSAPQQRRTFIARQPCHLLE